MLYVVEERGTFFQRFIAFFILLIVTKGGLYQGQLYYTNIIQGVPENLAHFVFGLLCFIYSLYGPTPPFI